MDLDIEYPKDIFRTVIREGSPYAFYLLQWVPYHSSANKNRLKLLHDVKHFDGRIEERVWPNGSSFGSFNDHEVEFIRLSKNQSFLID